MKCQRCEKERILSLNAKCSDMCMSVFKEVENEGYAPHIKNISGGDYINLEICLECGQVQGEFPQPNPDFYEELMEELEEDFDLCRGCQRSYSLGELNHSGLCQRCR